MSDFFEIDFLDVESNKSGDAICLRYSVGGYSAVHVVDGGFQSTGEALVQHIRTFYGAPSAIDHVVVSHNDGDHAGGIKYLLENYPVKQLWMLRPWLYAQELLPRFSRFANPDNLAKTLRDAYSNLNDIEEIALRKGVPIGAPFCGTPIGLFYAVSPSKELFLDLLVESDKTPTPRATAGITSLLKSTFSEAVAYIRAKWGDEVFPAEDTSSENEMSVVQYAALCGQRILLTADTGRRGLQTFVDVAPTIGVRLPGIDKFQVPHHGSRRNVSTILLDQILGPRLAGKQERSKFTGIVSSAKADEAHPRKAVVRAIYHRGGEVLTTEGKNLRVHKNGPDRGWSVAAPYPYPDDQESL